MTRIRKALATDNNSARELVRHSLLAYGIEAEFDGLDSAIGFLGTEYSPNAIELVAEFDNVLAGCVVVQSSGNAVAKLFGFHVDAELRGQGIGRSLLLAAIAEAKQIGFVQLKLDTWGSMDAAVRLYESLGWQRDCDPPPESGAERSYILAL